MTTFPLINKKNKIPAVDSTIYSKLDNNQAKFQIYLKVENKVLEGKENKFSNHWCKNRILMTQTSFISFRIILPISKKNLTL